MINSELSGSILAHRPQIMSLGLRCCVRAGGILSGSGLLALSCSWVKISVAGITFNMRPNDSTANLRFQNR